MAQRKEKEKKEVLVPYGSRSDAALVEPILRRCPWMTRLWLKGGDYLQSFIMTHNKLQSKQFDYVLIVGDRLEVTAAAYAAFHNNVPIIHYYAGVKNKIISTLDDINRHVITLWSDIQLVESWRCKRNVKKLCRAIGKKSNIRKIGITHLDNTFIDTSKVPNAPYNLILYNPTTKLNEIFNIIIGPNDDIRWYKTLPRAEFLGLLKNCNKFISNSSSCIYEAPYFLKKKQIIKLGSRNKNRTKIKPKRGGSNKIAKLRIFDTRTHELKKDVG